MKIILFFSRNHVYFWHIITKEQFQEAVPELKDFALLIETMKFEKSRIKHQTGIVWSTNATIKLALFYLGNGCKEIKLSRFLQDSLENVFSQTDAASLKPSALQFLYALRTVTINQGMLRKIKGSSEIKSGRKFSPKYTREKWR